MASGSTGSNRCEARFKDPHGPPLARPGWHGSPGQSGRALDGHRIEPASPGQAYDSEPPAEGHCYYTPLTVWNGEYTVGHGVAPAGWRTRPSFATRAGGGLGSGPSGIRVTLRWQWAAEASATLVVARQGSPPLGPSDPAAITETVSFADYDRLGLWTLNLPTTASPDAGLWHIRVYSTAALDGVRSISPGLDPTAATVLPGPNPEVTVRMS